MHIRDVHNDSSPTSHVRALIYRLAVDRLFGAVFKTCVCHINREIFIDQLIHVVEYVYV